jgi:hypothetical protein
MQFLKSVAIVSFFPPLIMLCYDLVDQFIEHNRFFIRPLQVWWNGWHDTFPKVFDGIKHVLTAVSSTAAVNKLFLLPGPLVLFIIPIFFFVLYRLLFMVSGGKTGGYKSRH